MSGLLEYGDIYMPMLTLFIYWLLRKKIAGNEKVIFIYAGASLVLFVISDILAFRAVNNLFLYHIYSLIELIIVSYYILKQVQNKSFPAFFFIISGAYTLCWILNIIFFEKPGTMNANSASIGNLVLLFLCMRYMFHLSQKDEILYFQKLPAFWIVSAFLVYCALSLLVYISYRYFVNYHIYAEADKVWTIMFIAIIIKFAFISVGLLCYRRLPSSQHLLLL